MCRPWSSRGNTMKVLALLLFLGTVGPVRAQQIEPTVLEPVVVTAAPETEVAEQRPDRSAFVTVIDLAPYEDRLSSLPEIVEQSAGVTIRRFGGLGSFSTASIRGSSSEQVAILLDGVPLNRAASGTVNLSNVPLENVERIEVYRGSAPLRFRSSAIGGVINVVTKEAGEDFSHQGSASYGSFNTYDISALGTGRQGRWGYVVTTDFRGSKGDFEFEDDNGTRQNPNDDRTTRRENNAFNSQNVLLKGTYAATPRITLTATNDYFQKREGVPGTGSNQSDSANLETYRNIFTLRAEKTEFFSENLDAEMSLHILAETTKFEDLEGEIGVGRQDTSNESRSWGLDSYLSYFLGEHQIVSLLGSYAVDRFDSEDGLTPGGGNKGLGCQIVCLLGPGLFQG